MTTKAMLFDAYYAQRPYPAGTVLVGGLAHAAHEYLTYCHDVDSPTWGDNDDQVAGYFELAAEKFAAFDNRENQLWEEEFKSAEHCKAWLNPLLDLEADDVRALSIDQLQQLDYLQFTVVVLKLNQGGMPQPSSIHVLAPDRQEAERQALDGLRLKNREVLDVVVCAVFRGYWIPEAE